MVYGFYYITKVTDPTPTREGIGCAVIRGRPP